MSIGRELVAEALAAGLLVQRNGDRIHFVSPLGKPLPAALRERIGQHKADVLAWLAYREEADNLLVATMSRVIDAYRIGVKLDSPDWQQASAAVTTAYQSGDIKALRTELEHYTRFALSAFAGTGKSAA
jgi:hypothetical protein